MQLNYVKVQKKSLNDIEKYGCDKSKAIDNIAFCIEEVQNVLDMHQISEKEGVYYFGGKAIYPSAVVVLPSERYELETKALAQVDLGQIEIPEGDNSINALKEMFTIYQARIEKIYNQIDMQSKALNEVYNTAKLQQKAADGHFIVPVLTKFVQLAEQYKKHDANIEKAESDEEAVEVYQKALESSVEYLTVMLQSLGVVIKDLGDEVDFKYQRAVNKIKSEDLVGKTIYIEHTITDCYMYNDRVFYPSKVRIGAK